MYSFKEGKYIYCIIGTKEPKTFGALGMGERQDELYTICFDGIAAVISNSPITQYSISRYNTLTHEKAIEAVMKEHTVLPVRFGTIAEDENKVKNILCEEYNNFKDLLERMKDKKELGLKAIFSAKGACLPDGQRSVSGGKEDIYNYILEKYQDIKRLKEKLQSLPPEKTVYQRMEIGRMVAEALEKEKQRYKEGMLNALEPLAEETKINSNYGEKMILNAAFLVHKDKEALFDQKIQEIGVLYGDKIDFKYIGIIPPFNFVNLVIDTSTPLSVDGERKSNHRNRKIQCY